MFGRPKKYKVDYCGSKKFYDGAENAYRAGRTVEIYYNLIATDTSYTFYLDGEALNVGYSDDKGFIIRFVMPPHDVKLTLETRNLMLADC